jgi:hypothetical protein
VLRHLVEWVELNPKTSERFGERLPIEQIGEHGRFCAIVKELIKRNLEKHAPASPAFQWRARYDRFLRGRYSNVLDGLHGAGKRGEFHVFRRFRFAVLPKAGVPDHLIKQWMGHSQSLADRYAAQLYVDVSYRREWCEKAGLGLELGELGYKGLFPIRPSLEQSARSFRFGFSDLPGEHPIDLPGFLRRGRVARCRA